MTLDEATEAATRLLDQRGQLLNGHLLRLVDGDKDLFRDVRERLIQLRVAEDRSGVGLARSESMTDASVDARHTESAESEGLSATPYTSEVRSPIRFDSDIVDWWVMKRGVAIGPMLLASLIEMQKRSELEPGDVVRFGAGGLWQQPDEVPELISVRVGVQSNARRADGGTKPYSDTLKVTRSLQGISSSSAGDSEKTHTSGPTGPATPNISPTRPDDGDDFGSTDEPPSMLSESFLPPDKIWSLGNNLHPGVLARAWNFSAAIVGGSRRLSGILFTLAAIAAFMSWWRLPPSNDEVIRKFTACHLAVRKLQDDRVGRSAWAPVVDRYRPRIRMIADRLQPYASERYPTENALYLAATQGLLRLLENPADPSESDRAFEKHMLSAADRKAR